MNRAVRTTARGVAGTDSAHDVIEWNRRCQSGGATDVTTLSITCSSKLDFHALLQQHRLGSACAHAFGIAAVEKTWAADNESASPVSRRVAAPSAALVGAQPFSPPPILLAARSQSSSRSSLLFLN